MADEKLTNEPYNICGRKVSLLRMQMHPKTSQNRLATLLQLEGIKCHKNTIQRIESRERRVSDIELKALAKVLHTTTDELLSDD